MTVPENSRHRALQVQGICPQAVPEAPQNRALQVQGMGPHRCSLGLQLYSYWAPGFLGSEHPTCLLCSRPGQDCWAAQLLGRPATGHYICSPCC